jgi:hypothetical protein
MARHHRIAVLAGGASCAAALAAAAIAGTPAVPAHRAGVARRSLAVTDEASAVTPSPLGLHPPLGHARPSQARAFTGSAAARAATGTASPWTPLQNQPPFGTPGTMLLESNGTVLVHDEPDNNVTGGTNQWWKLTPAPDGSYIDGTWSQIASMPASYDPLYFASAILPDGRMIVEGGEYLGENSAWTNQGAIYNPVTNTWKAMPPPPGWTNIGDAASDVLPDGTFMLQQPCQTCVSDPDLTVDDALLNPRTLRWTVIPGTGKNDPNDEEGWTLEPDGKLLTVDTWIPAATQLFSPRTRSWSFAGNTAPDGDPVDPFPVVEIGPQVEMPGGNTFVVGAGSSTQEGTCPAADTQTALYDYATGTWAAGPEIPPVGGEEYDATDGSASVLPDGNVLFEASACVYSTPTHFFLYDASSDTITQIPDVPNAPNDSSYYTRMLALPNGQVLFDDGSDQMEVYTAGGTPDPAWAPSISRLSSRMLAPGRRYRLSGTQLAGLDQGAAYGDDAQDNTNFPLVRVTNDATGVVTYARTFNWTSVSVAPGARSATDFTLPPGTPPGRSTLVVVANGIASSPVPVMIRR